MSGYDEDLLAPGTEASSYPRLNKPFSYKELTLALQQLLEA